MSNFKIGDAVYMRAGGPRMNVIARLDGFLYKCHWTDKESGPQVALFSESDLMSSAERNQRFNAGLARVLEGLSKR